MELNNTEKEDLLYRIKQFDLFLELRVPNRMSVVWGDWNIIKTRIQKLLSIAE